MGYALSLDQLLLKRDMKVVWLFSYALLRGPLKIAFEMQTSEICFGKAEEQNARRWCYSPSRMHFGLSTPPKRTAAVCSQNELLEGSLKFEGSLL